MRNAGEYEFSRVEVYGVGDVAYSLLVKQEIENICDSAETGFEYRIALLNLDRRLLCGRLNEETEMYLSENVKVGSREGDRHEELISHICRKIADVTDRIKKLEKYIVGEKMQKIVELKRRLSIINDMLNSARELVYKLERLRTITVIRIDELSDAEAQISYDKAQRAGVKSRIVSVLEIPCVEK